MVTISVVRETHPERLSDAAAQLAGKITSLDDVIAAQQRAVADLAASWRGTAADAAIAKANAHIAKLKSLAARLTAVKKTLADAGTNLTPLRTEILATAEQATILGAHVADDGTVTPQPWSFLNGGLMTDKVTEGYTASLKALLAEFDNLDHMTAHALDVIEETPDESVGELTRPTWSSDDLYAGDPSPTDIHQNDLGDCYLAATMGAIAQANPQWIKDRISYDPSTGQYDVTLWDGTQWRHIPVTQADVDANIASRGGSGVDTDDPTRPNHGAPLWPAVLESAYGKLNAPGQSPYPGIGRGGRTVNAMEALTGNKGTTLTPSQEWYRTQNVDQRISQALQKHEPVVLSTTDNVSGTGLYANHAYTVVGITGSGDDAVVTVRNPWGTQPDGSELRTISIRDLMGSGVSGALGNGPVQNVNIGQLG